MGYLQPAYNSGTFTCNASALSGAITNITIITAFYMQINNIITCNVYGTIDLDFSSIPYGTCSLTGVNGQINIGGSGSVNISLPNLCNGIIVQGQLEFNSNDNSIIVTNKAFSTIFTYQI